ncbi:MAG TPA: DUF4430 domain-containing protein [Thermoplasmata archaeon]|nr:DUF4430 domain-containing protein [Thermoplasmata archaeon]
MPRRLSERTQALIFLIVLGVAIAGLYGWAQASQAPPVPPGRVSGVSLLVDSGTWRVRYGPVTTTNNTAFGLLMEAARVLRFPVVYQYYQSPPGVFVISINGTGSGPSSSGWQYWVGTAYGDRGANLYPLSNGVNVTWRYGADQGGA